MKILLALIPLTLAAAPVFATDYNCAANQFTAALVFDDGPGGLDHFVITYGEARYTEIIWDRDAGTPNLFEASDTDTPDGRFDYAGNSLALGIEGTNNVNFVIDAKKVSPHSSALNGTLTVIKDGKTSHLTLKCEELR